jgi:23S rRNA (pseudouridine1915-N3)-methyltransferase
MRLLLVAIGRLKDGPERRLYDHYALRLNAAGRGVALSPFRLHEIAESRQASAAQRQTEEAERLLTASGDAGVRVVLDEGGRVLSSVGFADWLRKTRDDGAKEAAFLVGGPDGHGRDLLAAADLRLSLGAMTLPHGLARIVLVEQLYRAATIIAGHPYHRA